MSKQTEDFYNRFSFFYPFIDLFLRKQKLVLFDEINQLPFGDLLEIGVGNGSTLSLYKTHRVVGIDTSARMLEIAKRQAGNTIKLIQMNGEKLQFQDGFFDYVVLSHVIAVVDNPEKLLEEIYRVLKPKGRVLLLNHFTPSNWLKYLDKIFGFISTLFRFRSVFYLKDLGMLKRFSVLKEISLGRLSYFKLVILEKP